MSNLRIVSASCSDPVSFGRHTRLGNSLQRLAFDPRIRASVAFGNCEGLSAVYNRAIRQVVQDVAQEVAQQASSDEEILLFIHDDVFIDDYHVAQRLDDALRVFDVVGLAGNTRPDERHVGWAFWRDGQSAQNRWYDKKLLSGAVAHFTAGGERVSFYGPAPQECLLLDGCFLAARVRAFREHNHLRFDERFRFHFYDIDFCRACRSAGLRLGTWPIAATHASGGKFGTPEWEQALGLYRSKWSRVVNGNVMGGAAVRSVETLFVEA